jgi:hypothetical protein
MDEKLDLEIFNLLTYVNVNIKDNVKEMHYIELVGLIQKIYLKSKEKKEVVDDDDEDQEYGGQYI